MTSDRLLSMTKETNLHSYSLLDPDMIIHAIESLDYVSDGRILALNSYENRVYQVGIEDEAPIIAKFYRAGRWTDEHDSRRAHFYAGIGKVQKYRWLPHYL